MNALHNIPCASRAQRGATLIEVLVAVLVLSFGLLGLGALQTVSLRSNSNSFFRTQAVNLSYEIIDELRANRMGIRIAGGYSNDQLAEWVDVVDDVLPGGVLEIADAQGGVWDCNLNACDSVRIRIRWVDQTQQGTGGGAAGYDESDVDNQWFESVSRI